MKKQLNLSMCILCTLLFTSTVDATSIYRIKENLPKGTVLTEEHLVEVPMSKKPNFLIDALQERLLYKNVTDRRLKRYLGRALPHDLPKDGYLMRNDFTLFGSVENVPLAKNPPRDFRPMLETDIQTIDDDSIAWLDDDRLMFVGLDPADPNRKSQYSRGKKHLYEWDTRSGEISIYRRDVVGNLCISGSWMRVRVEHTTERFSYEVGSYGALRPITGRELHYPGNSELYHHSSFHCSRMLPDQEFVAIAGALPRTSVYPLREQDGYLAKPRYRDFDKREVIYQRPGQPPMDLGFDPFDIRLYTVKFLPFSGRYFIEYDKRSSSEVEYTRSNCSTSWWMEPNGDLEPVCLPWGPWFFVEPYRDGFVLASTAIRNPSDGLHLQTDGRLVQLLNAMITEVKVSPNGCRLALVTRTVKVAPNRQSSEIGPWLPKVMELCNDAD